MPPRRSKSSDSFDSFFLLLFFQLKIKSIDRYYPGKEVLNQLMKFIFQKHHQKKMKWSFLKHRKKLSIESFIRIKNIMIIKNSTGPPRIRQRKSGSLLSSYVFISKTQFIRLLQG